MSPSPNHAKRDTEALRKAFIEKVKTAEQLKNDLRIKMLSEKFKKERIKYELLIKEPELQRLSRQNHISKCKECQGPVRVITVVGNKVYVSLSDKYIYLQLRKIMSLFCMLHFDKIYTDYIKFKRFFSLRNESCVICYIEKLENEITRLRMEKNNVE